MPACKDKYEWCEDEPFVYKDGEGIEYCVFHAPKEEKGFPLREFNKKIFGKNRMIGKSQRNKHVQPFRHYF